MKSATLFALALIYSITTMAQNPYEYPSSINRQKYPVYNGNDLGLTYKPTQTTIKVYAPTMRRMQCFLYNTATEATPARRIEMRKVANGIFVGNIIGNHEDKFYTLRVFDGKRWSKETTDPYSTSVSVNGEKTAIIDLQKTNPAGWEKDKSPGNFSKKIDAIIYELHVRDATIHPSSGVMPNWRGKFLGLTQAGTTNSFGQSTGLDHLKQLGVTHVQLLPFFDYNSVDESRPNDPQYNWGYDPLHFNVPEGSYSTDATNPTARVKELKELVQTFHKNGLRVIMDVVYNHTANTNTNFQTLVPNYYYRTRPDGTFSDASACGNETASEAPMFRKFMIESMVHWVKEYHIDGFRMDLMAIHDIETINQISKALHAIKPDILIFGEGWTAGGSPLDAKYRALKANAAQFDRVGVFSDEVRDGMKGRWNEEHDYGFISGKTEYTESVKFGVVAATAHPQLNLSKVINGQIAFANEPSQCLVYNECHDNHTLWDRLVNSTSTANDEVKKRMYKLGQVVVFTSQGTSFMHAGQELYRTKFGIDNSYNKPDSINQILWDKKTEHKEMVEFTQNLIKLRKGHSVFRLNNNQAIAQKIKFIDAVPNNCIAYTIEDDYCVIIYSGNTPAEFTMPKISSGQWGYLLKEDQFYTKEGNVTSIKMNPYSAYILTRGNKTY
jgi:pullulanase